MQREDSDPAGWPVSRCVRFQKRTVLNTRQTGKGRVEALPAKDYADTASLLRRLKTDMP